MTNMIKDSMLRLISLTGDESQLNFGEDEQTGLPIELIAGEKDNSTMTIPDQLPILPLRGMVVYPETAVPLTVGQPRSIKLVDEVSVGERMVGLIASKNPEIDNPQPVNLYEIGTVAIIHRLFRAPDNTIRLLVQGVSRFKINNYTQNEPYLKASVQLIPEEVEEGIEIEAIARNARDQFEQIAELVPSIPKELVASISILQEPLQTVYTIANFLRMELAEAQEILEINSASEKLKKLIGILAKEKEVLEIGQKIQNEARSEIDKVQREYFLREQLKAIRKELGEEDEQTADIESFREKIEKAKMPDEAYQQSTRELERLSRLPTAAAEHGVIRTYLDWLVSLPWSNETEDNLDITHAMTVLEEDHYGLKDVKERIIEFLAVRKLKLERKTNLENEPEDYIRKDRAGVILCFIGPPGVGKTSLGRSIARALGRKFIRISLGGIRDEAEIRGHRRTYIGALPGKILQSLRRSESLNPVFMLDEIDKLSSDFRGDPASALLEVLDPEQNTEFRDHYLEVAFDLSKVMFITTANTFDTIPGPLLDRMEVIRLSGYTEREKIAIAQKYLVPRQLRESGLHQEEISFDESALRTIIRYYTRESGVRNLEREIGAVCRKIVIQVSQNKPGPYTITEKEAREHLGRPRFPEDEEINWRTSVPGVATGLAWTQVGGDILFIEATKMPGSKGFKITGSVGKVMEESAQAALSYIRSHSEQLGIDPKTFENNDIHLHIPSGAVPKDGPSAGITITTALYSLLKNAPLKHNIGMTGEITLRGQVMPVGGIKEKVLAAHRAGLKTIYMPKLNEDDIEDLPEDVKNAITFKLIESIDEVLSEVLEFEKTKKVTKKTRMNDETINW